MIIGALVGGARFRGLPAIQCTAAIGAPVLGFVGTTDDGWIEKMGTDFAADL